MWEYLIVPLAPAEEILQPALNALGQHGWRLTQVQVHVKGDYLCFFERPHREGSPPPELPPKESDVPPAQSKPGERP